MGLNEKRPNNPEKTNEKGGTKRGKSERTKGRRVAVQARVRTSNVCLPSLVPSQAAFFPPALPPTPPTRPTTHPTRPPAHLPLTPSSLSRNLALALTPPLFPYCRRSRWRPRSTRAWSRSARCALRRLQTRPHRPEPLPRPATAVPRRQRSKSKTSCYAYATARQPALFYGPGTLADESRAPPFCSWKTWSRSRWHAVQASSAARRRWRSHTS